MQRVPEPSRPNNLCTAQNISTAHTTSAWTSQASIIFAWLKTSQPNAQPLDCSCHQRLNFPNLYNLCTVQNISVKRLVSQLLMLWERQNFPVSIISTSRKTSQSNAQYLDCTRLNHWNSLCSHRPAPICPQFNQRRRIPAFQRLLIVHPNSRALTDKLLPHTAIKTDKLIEQATHYLQTRPAQAPRPEGIIN